MKVTVILLLFISTYYPVPTQTLSKELIRFAKPTVLGVIDSTINGTRCARDLKKFIVDLYKLKPWALDMLDANSKFQSGIFNGNLQLYGNYDQCLAIQKILNGSEITGKYCTVPITFKRTVRSQVENLLKQKQNGKNVWKMFVRHVKMYFGLCIPKSCSIKSLNRLWQKFQKVFKVPVEATFLEESCYHSETSTVTKFDTFVFTFFSGILILEIICTSYDLYKRKKREKPGIFISFSLYSNTLKLFSTQQAPDSLSCLQGIKLISIIWILVGHIAVSKVMSPNINTSYLLEWKQNLENSFYFGAAYAVDTFFSISGLLLVYVCLKYIEEIENNIFWFYLHRILRLSPVLVAVILIDVSVVKFLTEGPYFYFLVKCLKNDCEKNWWATLFFANNLLKYSEQCNPQTWYLSIDTHMYAFSPLILFGLKRNRSKTFLGISLACVFSYIYSWTTVIRNKFGFVLFYELTKESASYTYLSTISRMPSWLIGTYFGYLLHMHKMKLKKIKFSKILNFWFWVISLSTMLFLVLYQNVLLTEEYNVYRSAFFNTFSRSLWSLSVCWIILSCCSGHAEIVNTFLSHPIFVVLGRLTYSIYLVHLTVIQVVLVKERQPAYFSNFQIFCDFWSNAVITLICAAALCLMFEYPAVGFMKNIYKKNKEI